MSAGRFKGKISTKRIVRCVQQARARLRFAFIFGVTGKAAKTEDLKAVTDLSERNQDIGSIIKADKHRLNLGRRLFFEGMVFLDFLWVMKT
ncbi:MAG: hypothetical protein MN733_32240 [Nitrososphaera sp.]|nr:hypothetical protein [Nitrososphaera sp.]